MSSPKSSRRAHRCRANSSLSGIFEADVGTSPETNVEGSAPPLEMVAIARKLRQAKRQLFLKTIQQPRTPVDQLRKLVLDLTVDSMDEYPEVPSLRRPRSTSPLEPTELHRARSNTDRNDYTCV